MPDLIDLIYQTATDADKWPQLIQSLTEEIAEQQNISADELLPNDKSDSLHNHFQRALQVSKRIRDLESQNNSLGLSLNFINLPVVLIDAQQHILDSNQQAKKHFQNHHLIDIEQSHLIFANDTLQQQFQSAFQKCSEQNSMQTVRLADQEQHNISLNIIRFDNTTLENDTYLVLFANQNITDLPSASSIQSTFELTKVESELAYWVSTGLANKIIAEKMEISYHTCRTHLKNIYQKTDTHSQAELSYKIFTDCIPLSEQDDSAPLHPYRHVDHQMRLSDGRTLSFAEYGPIQGDTVFYMHTIVGSRKQIHPDFKLLYKYNIRMILPERPSVGLSSPQPNRTLHDWPKDMAELVEYLHLSRFSVIGFQVGAEYALVCGQYFPKQLTAMHLIGMRTPPEIVSPYPDPFPLSRMMLKLARTTPKILHTFLRITNKCFLKNPAQHLKDIVMLSCDEDKQVLDDKRLMAIFIEGTLESTRLYMGDALVQELQIVQQNWQIDFEKIDSQVHIWHSRHDPQLPFPPVEKMMEHFKQCQPHIYNNNCVLLAIHKWPEILQALRSDFDHQTDHPSL